MSKEEMNKDMDKTQVYKIKRKKRTLNPKAKKLIKISIIALILLLLIGTGIVFGVVYGIVKDARLSVADLAIKNQNSVVKDINGNTIAVLSGEENREIISITDMSKYLPKAFVAIEDERFYEHYGVDVKRTGAAIFTYILHGGSSSFGGSTITQQVIKNLTNDKDRNWERKVKEWTRAYYIEKDLSKDQILEIYLNLVFLGGNAYGVEVGSMYYFNKSASQLDLAECAFLAGINNSPNIYNPFSTETSDIEKIKQRTKTVLNKMHELGKIETEEEYNQAIAKVEAGLIFTKGTIRQTIYSYHTDAAITQIIKELQEKNDWKYEYAKLYLFSSGFTIYTTQDSTIQSAMESEFKKDKYQIASRKTKDENGNYVSSQAAMVLIDHKTGNVLATVGKLGEKTDSFGFNRGTQAKRQTGSSMKPLAVLAPAINKGIVTAATVFDDVPTSFGNFRPKNWNEYKGLVTVRYAIEDSQNIPMVKAMQTLGPENSIEFLESIGISSLDEEKDNSLALALGGLTYGITPLEMAAGYATIANDGIYIKPTFYTKVVNSNGDTIIETNQETKTIMSSAAAYVVKEILTQPVKAGTASYCGISGISVAAKTGTTNDDYDRWLCGFTPYYTAATWFGYDENETVRYSGSNPAGAIWSNVIKAAHVGLKNATFADTRPNDVVTATVCKDSGLLVTDVCKNDPRGDRAYTEYFVKGTVPTKYCSCHVSVDICKDSGLLANEYCTNRETKVFITRPDSDTNSSWKSARDAEYMLTIKDTCTIHTTTPDITKPEIILNGLSEITLNINEKYKEERSNSNR